MADVSITAANVARSTTSIQAFPGTLAANVTQGQILEVSNSAAVILAQSNAANAPKSVGWALTAGSVGQPILWAASDPAFKPGATLTAGATAYLSDNAGAFTVTYGDIATGSTVIALGVANTNGTINFQPIVGGVHP